MTIHEANKRLLFQLYELYDNYEAANIADLVMENITGWKRIDRVVNKQVKLSLPMEQLLDRYTNELLTHKPVQYVLSEAWFGGMKLFVNDNVLIPRPETEELADLAVKEVIKNRNKAVNIIDIGTGSGCIPVFIKNKLPEANVYSIDVSKEALKVAEQNARGNNVWVNFLHADILHEHEWNPLPSFNHIISNPPYIPSSERNKMPDNVTKFEPHLALFVPDDDPLIFYKSIAAFAENKLLAGGKIFLELHEDLTAEAVDIFYNFRTEIKKDMQGKDRFLIASDKHYNNR